MNTYSEIVRHYTLNDGSYEQILKFCIDASVNFMISFPDVESDGYGRYIPFDEKKSSEDFYFSERKLYFGNRTTGIELCLREDVHEAGGSTLSSDTISAETYGLSDKQRVFIKCFRDAGETYFNWTVELEITAPEDKADAVIDMFRSSFRTDGPDDEKIKSIVSTALSKVSGGRWDDAADDASYVLQYRPDEPEALMALGIADVARGEWRGAKKNLLKAVEKLHGNFEAWYNLGLAYRSGSDNGSALECFERALELDPENHAAYYMKGMVLDETGRDDEAVESLRYAVKYSPDPGALSRNGGMDFTLQAKEALSRLGRPWRGDEELPPPEGIDVNEDLIRAASEGDVRSIGKLLLKGASVNYRPEDKSRHGRTPLITAAINGHLHAVRYLIAHGADKDIADNSGCGALGSSIEWGENRDVILLLIKEGSDVNGKDPYGRPVILNTRALSDPAVLDALVNGGADINSADENGANGVFCAASAGELGGVRFFIEHGLNADSRDRNGCTPLMIAVRRNDCELIKYLLGCGAEVNSEDSGGKTPLMAAAENCAAESLKILAEAGASVNARDKSGRSAIDILMEHGSRKDMDSFRECVDILTDAGAELIRGGNK